MRIIVNADDFGRTREVNRAVIAAHERGVLTSASLMIAEDAADDAVRLAKKHPTLAVGLHVVAVDGRAAMNAGEVDRLVDAQGRFPNAPVRLGIRYAFSRGARRQLAAELRAQFERFAATGLPLSHVDAHQHLHMHPAVFDLLLPLALEFGARGIRIVSDDLPLALRHDSRNRIAKTVSSAVFALLARRCRRRCAGTSLACADRTFGFHLSGAMREPYVLDVIESLRRQTWKSAEIYFHPTSGPALADLGPNPDDLATLLSPRVRQQLADSDLRLGTYADLSSGVRAPEPAPAASAIAVH